jgi:hypothetical protein
LFSCIQRFEVFWIDLEGKILGDLHLGTGGRVVVVCFLGLRKSCFLGCEDEVLCIHHPRRNWFLGVIKKEFQYFLRKRVLCYKSKIFSTLAQSI